MASRGDIERVDVTTTVSPVSLDGRLVRLRPITTADYGFLWQCRQSPEIMPLWMQGRTIPSYEQYVRELEAGLSGRTLALLLIETSDAARPIGFVSAYDYSPQDRYTFLNAVLDPGHTDLAWGAETALLFLDYLFAYFDLRKVCIDLCDFNRLPLAMLLRQGARMEGRFRGQRYYRGTYHDVIRLGLLQEEWRAARPALVAMLTAPEATQTSAPAGWTAPAENQVIESEAGAARPLGPAGDAATVPPLSSASRKGSRSRGRRARQGEHQAGADGS